jgi:hypothetical protein
MSFSIFFLFQFCGFKTCGLLYVEFTQENRKFTTLYIYIYIYICRHKKINSLVGKLNKQINI